MFTLGKGFCFYAIAFLFFGLALLFAFGFTRDLPAATLFSIRGPRMFHAFVVGASLVLGGIVFQSIFNNPIIEPYHLGISSIASLGGVIAQYFFPDFNSFGFMAICLGFTLGVSFSLLLLSHFLRFSSRDLLLVGTFFGIFCSGIFSALLLTQGAGRERQILGWLFGDLSRADPRITLGLFILSGLVLLFFLASAKTLDLMAFGKNQIRNFYLNPQARKNGFFILVCTLTSFCVATSGMIGYLGLLIPHLVRVTHGATHRGLLIRGYFLGGLFLVVADGLSREVIFPQELPVGLITALFGIPVLLTVYFRKRRIDG